MESGPCPNLQWGVLFEIDFLNYSNKPTVKERYNPQARDKQGALAMLGVTVTFDESSSRSIEALRKTQN